MKVATSFRVVALGVALTVPALMRAPPAAAQAGTRTAVFVINDAPATIPTGERVAAKGQPLLRQKATATRAAVLDADAPSPFNFGKVRGFPAGTRMFGVPTQDGGVAFCAVAASTARWWSGDRFACYRDTDHDGAFDQVLASGEPFMNVGLFVFDLGQARPLAKPVRYHRLPYGQGPSTDYAVTWSLVAAEARKGQPPPAPTGIEVHSAFEGRDGLESIGGTGKSTPLISGQPSSLSYRGGQFTILGLTADGGLRYRVDHPLPAQLTSVVMAMRYAPATPVAAPR